MNEEQYRQVCEACDSVLLSPDADLKTIAIPWLHVIREHPSFLEHYEPLFAASTTWPYPFNIVAKNVRNIAGWLRQAWKALRSDGEPWKASQPLSGPVDVLFVSHLLNDRDAGKASDFYFGNLPELIQVEGRRVVVALIDHSMNQDASHSLRWDTNVSTRVLLSNSLGFKDELSLYCRLRRESSRLASHSRREVPGLLKEVLSFAAREAMSGGARTTLRMSVQVDRLVARINPKIMIITYEGHAWERVVFATARRQSANLQCVGYLHAAMFRLQHGASRMLGHAYDPHLVLTAGPVSRAQIEPPLALQGVAVRVLGSSRASTDKQGVAASTIQTGQSRSEPFAKARPTCLVLPEGIISECLLLFKFSLECAELMPEVTFIWRLHPLVNLESLREKNPRFRRLPENVEFSRDALEDDCRRSRYALYRGSTTVVKAVSYGVWPIYLSQPREMTIDPLYELDQVRAKVSSPEEFLRVTHEKEVSPNADLFNQKVVEIYCDNFYAPLDTEVITSMLG